MLSVIEELQNYFCMEHYNSCFLCEILLCSNLKLEM